MSDKTRQLSIQLAVGGIITQWLELKIHFQIMRNTENGFYYWSPLWNVFRWKKKLSILFMHSIFSELQYLNKLFSSKSDYKAKLLDDLTLIVGTYIEIN